MPNFSVLAAALFVCGCEAPPEVPRVWVLEKEYSTSCLTENARVFHDAGVVYSSQGWADDNHFTALDLITGACSRAAMLPAGFVIRPLAASSEYLFVNDGPNSRYSIYDKSKWRRAGTIRLALPIRSAVMRGDRLHVLQEGSNAPSLAVFAVPSLNLIEERSLSPAFIGFPNLVSEGFWFAAERRDRMHIAILDLNGDLLREADIPLSDREPHNCQLSSQPLGERAMLVQTGCGVYAVVDIETLQVQYDVTLSEGALFAEAYLSGDALYLLEEQAGTPGAPARYDPVLVDFATGRRLGELPALTSSTGFHLQLGDRLIWTAYDGPHLQMRVQVFDLRPS